MQALSRGVPRSLPHSPLARAWAVAPRLVAALLGVLLLLRTGAPRASVGALFAAADTRTEAAARRADDRCAAAAAGAGAHARAPAGPACLRVGGERGDSGPVLGPSWTPGAPLHLILRVAVGERAHSGGRRFLGLRKAPLVLATLASLRAALEALAGRGPASEAAYARTDDELLSPASGMPARVDVTAIYDGLQGDAAGAAAWRAAVDALLAGGWLGPFPLTLHHVAASEAGPTVGNRGTNLLQFRLFRELPCAAAAAGGTSATNNDDEPRIYFVEDDYVHAPTALTEILEVLALPWLDGSAPARFVTPFDHPDRLRAGGVNNEASAVRGGARRAWRSQSSTTMTFAGRCSDVLRVLPTLEALAPDDIVIWSRLQATRFAGVVVGTRLENRLMGPTTSLAIHGTAGDVPYYAPPSTGYASWCAFVLCLRDAAVAQLAARAPAALALLNRSLA